MLAKDVITKSLMGPHAQNSKHGAIVITVELIRCLIQ